MLILRELLNALHRGTRCSCKAACIPQGTRAAATLGGLSPAVPRPDILLSSSSSSHRAIVCPGHVGGTGYLSPSSGMGMGKLLSTSQEGRYLLKAAPLTLPSPGTAGELGALRLPPNKKRLCQLQEKQLFVEITSRGKPREGAARGARAGRRAAARREELLRLSGRAAAEFP